MKQPTLKPSDLATALEIGATGRATLAAIAECSAKSIGETHNAIRRLAQSGLLIGEDRLLALDAFLQFIRWGVPVAFPAVVGGPAIGFGTASLDLAGDGPADGATAVAAGNAVTAEYVWPSADGATTGNALTPLYPGATRLIARNPQLATMLSLIDVVRVGGSRERDAAVDTLARRLRPARG
jgi:hypothetical protein